jgi:hypothetical protein
MEQVQPFIGIQAPRIPFIRFEQRPVEKRTETGELRYEDTDFALITAQGSKDTTEKIWKEWIPQIKRAAADGMYPPGWIPRFEEMYKIWKETNADPVMGTPVKNWPAISPAECKILLFAGVRSIEDLAEANEEWMGKIGMGARRLKQLAIDWISANQAQGPLVAQLDTLRQTVEAQGQQIKALMEANASLAREATEAKQASVGSRFPIGMPSPEDRLADVRDSSNADEAEALDDILKS